LNTEEPADCLEIIRDSSTGPHHQAQALLLTKVSNYHHLHRSAECV